MDASGRAVARLLLLLSCAAFVVTSPNDGLIGRLRDAIKDATVQQLHHVRTGAVGGKLHPGDSSVALYERCIRPLEASMEAARATRAGRPAGAWPGDKWWFNPAVDLAEDAVFGATEIAVPLRADGSTGLGWCAR